MRRGVFSVAKTYWPIFYVASYLPSRIVHFNGNSPMTVPPAHMAIVVCVVWSKFGCVQLSLRQYEYPCLYFPYLPEISISHIRFIVLEASLFDTLDLLSCLQPTDDRQSQNPSVVANNTNTNCTTQHRTIFPFPTTVGVTPSLSLPYKYKDDTTSMVPYLSRL